VEELKSVVVRAQAGDLDAYTGLVRRFQDMAVGRAFAYLGDYHLAEDAAQDAFIEAFRSLDRIREPAAFPGWFRRIVIKRCDRLARRRPMSTAPLEAAAGVPLAGAGPLEAAHDSEMRGKVLAALQALPHDQRSVTTLFYVDGYSTKDIGEFLEVPIGTVKRRLHDSRRQLRQTMESTPEEAPAAVPDQSGERAAFLLKLADRISAGHPVEQVLHELEREAHCADLRCVVRRLLDAVTRAKGP